jgi:hypothetical protein
MDRVVSHLAIAIVGLYGHVFVDVAPAQYLPAGPAQDPPRTANHTPNICPPPPSAVAVGATTTTTTIDPRDLFLPQPSSADPAALTTTATTPSDYYGDLLLWLYETLNEPFVQTNDTKTHASFADGDEPLLPIIEPTDSSSLSLLLELPAKDTATTSVSISQSKDDSGSFCNSSEKPGECNGWRFRFIDKVVAHHRRTHRPSMGRTPSWHRLG